jgi:hypothetical protein
MIVALDGSVYDARRRMRSVGSSTVGTRAMSLIRASRNSVDRLPVEGGS